jgi:hypothetical protein
LERSLSDKLLGLIGWWHKAACLVERDERR